MKGRRMLAVGGFALALMLFLFWLYLSLVPRFGQPGVKRYEFWAKDGTEVAVENGRLAVRTPGTSAVATDDKDLYDAIIVGGLFLVAGVVCFALYRTSRSPTSPAAGPGAAKG